jgi:hypothetical protein
LWVRRRAFRRYSSFGFMIPENVTIANAVRIAPMMA